MLAAFAEAARIFSDGTSSGSSKDPGASINKRYYLLATRNAEFLLAHLRQEGKLHRSWRAGSTTDEVFLEDYALAHSRIDWNSIRPISITDGSLPRLNWRSR